MPESKLREIITRFFEELGEDVLEERVVQYIVRELKNGRHLKEILEDPYVTNRLSEEKVAKILSNPEIIDTLQQQIEKTFEEFKFFE